MNTYERINGLRKEKGVTLAFLNEKIGGYRGKLTDVKNGKVSLNELEIEIIAKELGTTAKYLTSEEVKQKEKPAPKTGNGQLPEGYFELNPENKALVDSVIARLLASQSEE